MNQITFKKIFIVIVVIVLLAHTGRIMKFIKDLEVGDSFSDSMRPLRESPSEAKFSLALLFFALVYMTIFKLLQMRISRKRFEDANRPQIYIVPMNNSPQRDSGTHDNKQNKRDNRGQNN